jgi:hypothetical protein
MIADEVREALEEEIGSPFADATWNRLCRNYLRDFLEDQRSETWHTLREVAEDLSEYEQELKQEWASGDGVEPGTKKRRLPQKKSRQNQEAADGHWFPELRRETALRAEVYGEYLAKVAADVHYVASYRKRLLGERMATLTPDQAQGLVRSAAPRRFRPIFSAECEYPSATTTPSFLIMGPMWTRVMQLVTTRPSACGGLRTRKASSRECSGQSRKAKILLGLISGTNRVRTTTWPYGTIQR